MLAVKTSSSSSSIPTVDAEEHEEEEEEALKRPYSCYRGIEEQSNIGSNKRCC
jgi:hypothetical protein